MEKKIERKVLVCKNGFHIMLSKSIQDNIKQNTIFVVKILECEAEKIENMGIEESSEYLRKRLDFIIKK